MTRLRGISDSRHHIRKQSLATFEVLLPASIAAAVCLAARKANMTPASLLTDIIRDAFEPVFAGRGELATQSRSTPTPQEESAEVGT